MFSECLLCARHYTRPRVLAMNKDQPPSKYFSRKNNKHVVGRQKEGQYGWNGVSKEGRGRGKSQREEGARWCRALEEVLGRVCILFYLTGEAVVGLTAEQGHGLTCILEGSLWLLCGKRIERVKGKSRVTSLEDLSRQAINKPSLRTCKNQMCRKIVWKKIHQKVYRGFLGYGIKNRPSPPKNPSFFKILCCGYILQVEYEYVCVYTYIHILYI